MTIQKIHESVNNLDWSDIGSIVDLGHGYSARIVRDEHCESPREYDNYTTMLTMHGRYQIGDKHPYESWMFSGWEEFRKQIERDYNVVVIQPLYMYDHGSISISTRSFIGRAHHARWDSGQIGWVFVTREAVANLQGWKRITAGRKEELIEWMNSEVREYDQWQRGECYGYQVEYEGEHIDSCYGYIGDAGFDFVKEEIQSHIKYHYHQKLQGRFQRLKELIKNHVPLHIRQSKLKSFAL